MSNFETIVGKVFLPSAELATVKREFRNHHNSVIEKAYDQLKRFRAANMTSSGSKWSSAIEKNDDINSPEMTAPKHIAMVVARSLDRPRAVKWSDFTLPYYSKAGVSETIFPILGHNGVVLGQIEFKGRNMTWVINEGNHAVDFFFDSTDSGFLYNTLDNVVWTRGTGGGETYKSERKRELEITKTYGPTGKKYQASLDKD